MYFSEHGILLSLILYPKGKVTEDTNIRHDIKLEKYIDLSKDPGVGQVVTLTGSELPDLIIGNKKDYHISGGKGEDHLYGSRKEGKDVFTS